MEVRPKREKEGCLIGWDWFQHDGNTTEGALGDVVPLDSFNPVTVSPLPVHPPLRLLGGVASSVDLSMLVSLAAPPFLSPLLSLFLSLSPVSILLVSTHRTQPDYPVQRTTQLQAVPRTLRRARGAETGKRCNRKAAVGSASTPGTTWRPGAARHRRFHSTPDYCSGPGAVATGMISGQLESALRRSRRGFGRLQDEAVLS